MKVATAIGHQSATYALCDVPHYLHSSAIQGTVLALTACVAVEFTNVRHRCSLSSVGLEHLMRTSLSERPRHYLHLSAQTISVQLCGERCEACYRACVVHTPPSCGTERTPVTCPLLRPEARALYSPLVPPPWLRRLAGGTPQEYATESRALRVAARIAQTS